MKPKYIARYTAELIVNSQVVDPQGCNSITFQNVGVSPATLMNTISMIGTTTYGFNAVHPEEVITNSFAVSFQTNEVPQILVIRKFITLGC